MEQVKGHAGNKIDPVLQAARPHLFAQSRLVGSIADQDQGRLLKGGGGLYLFAEPIVGEKPP